MPRAGRVGWADGHGSEGTRFLSQVTSAYICERPQNHQTVSSKGENRIMRELRIDAAVARMFSFPHSPLQMTSF